MNLNKNWELYCLTDKDYRSEIKSSAELNTKLHFKNISLPALLENILFKNKIAKDPYYSTNCWDYQKYEDLHQFYVIHFSSKKKSKCITFEGIDTIADIYLNGKKIAKVDNMYLSYTFLLNDLKKNNEILVHIYPCVIEGRKYDLSKILIAQKYAKEGVYLRKSACSFGWDIMTRTPLGGIYKNVKLFDKLELVKDFYVSSSLNEDLSLATLKIETSFNKKIIGRIRVEGKCEDSFFSKTLEISEEKATTSICLDNPKLWNIRGYGKQYLYEIKLFVNDVLVKTIKHGIREVILKRSSLVEENGCFSFYINKQKVFLLGSNYVPVEAINHVDKKRMKKAIEMTLDLGCNCLRVWGGGTYEEDEFYSICDEKGIFIWQDFMMACAVYPQDEDFLDRMAKEVRYIVTKLRNHPSICLWAGDNENDLAAGCWEGTLMNPNENKITRILIPNILKELDNSRPFLPSSPYVDEKAVGHYDKLSEYHLWGPRDYFKSDFYKNTYPYFVSETGYHALNNHSSLKKFLKKSWPLFKKGTTPTLEYLAHSTSVVNDYNSPYAYRIKLMYDQVVTLFKKASSNEKEFILQSQISQGEALKFFIEKMRKDYSRNGGIIWWNLLDGWPQISDAVVDYYFSKKLAYSYIKSSQQESLFLMDEKEDEIVLYLSSSLQKEHTYEYEIIDGYDNDKIIMKGRITSKPNASIIVSKLNKDDALHFYIIKYKDENNNEYLNHFHTNIIGIDLNNYLKVAYKYNLFLQK